MPFSRCSNAHRACLRVLAILLLTSGGLPVGNAGNARQPIPDTPAEAGAAQASA